MEWIILDNGTDPIYDLLPQDERIRYHRLSGQRLNHGQLMNRAFASALGQVCVVWDDDDWYAPDRISRLVAPLENPDKTVSGTSRLYYYVQGTEEAYRYQNWTTGHWMAAIALRRSYWEEHPFAEVPSGADYQLLRTIPLEKWADLNTLDLMVATIHDTNAAPKTLPNMSFIPVPWDKILEVTHGESL